MSSLVHAAFAAAMLSVASSTAGAPPSSLLAVDRDGGELLVVDPTTMALRHRIAVGTAPHEVTGSPDGRLAYVANYGTKEEPGSSISVVDVDTGKERQRIDVRPFLRPHGLRLVGDKLYFTSEVTRTVARLDLGSGRVDWALGLGQAVSHMLDVSPDGRRLYTTNMLSDTVSAVDIDAPPHTPLRHAQVGKMPEGIAVSPDGRTIWVGENGSGRIVVLDATTLETKATLEAGSYPARIMFSRDGRHAFAADPKTSEVLLFDANARTLVRRIPVEGVPLGMLPSPDGRSLYVTLAAAGRVARVDLGTFTIDGVADVGRVADGIGWAGPVAATATGAGQAARN